MDIQKPVFQRSEKIKFDVGYILKIFTVNGDFYENIMNGILYGLSVKTEVTAIREQIVRIRGVN